MNDYLATHQLTEGEVARSLASKNSRFDRVNLEDLKIDMRFQRAVNQNAVRKIKDEYHPAGLGPLLVAKIDGDIHLSVVDGQTRLHALQALPLTSPMVMAEVFDSLTAAEAALLFRLRNNQKPIPPKERDRVAVTEGDAVMTEVIRQAKATDYVVFDEDPERITMSHLTEAKAIVRWGFEKEFPDLLARALLIQDHAFRPVDGTLEGTVHPKILAATAELILRNPGIDDDELARVMSEAQLPALQAQIERKAILGGTRLKGAAKAVLVERYNKGKKRPDHIIP